MTSPVLGEWGYSKYKGYTQEFFNETNELKNFIQKNKFLSKKQVIEHIITAISLYMTRNNSKIARQQVWLLCGLKENEEYYNYMKKIYENIFNDEIVGKYAKKIYSKGGMEDLQIVFYILTLYSPFTNNPKTYTLYINYKETLDRAFEKHIEEWKC